MTKKLLHEVKQKKDFVSPEEELMLNVMRTADFIRYKFELLIKPYDLSFAQYNILRILRGSLEEGLINDEIRARLLTQVPDMPRLLSRLEKSQLITRERDSKDGRATRNHLTEKGQNLLRKLDPCVSAFPDQFSKNMPQEELAALINRLECMRDLL